MDCRIDCQLGVLWGVVQASQKTTCYNVKIDFKPSKREYARCSCPVGCHGKCHHIAAVLYYASKNISCTNTACKKSFKAKAGHGNEGLPIDTFYPPSKPGYKSIPGPLSPQEVKEARSRLPACMSAAAGIKWFTGPEPLAPATDHNVETIEEVRIPSMEEAILSPGFSESNDKLKYVSRYFRLSDIDIESIANATKGQASNRLWHLLRRNRITASIVGKVIKACGGFRSCTSLMKQISGTGSSLGGIRAIDWGRRHEKTAVDAFCKQFPEKKVVESGMWLDRYGVIGASPDRLCDNDAVIEVKCPYSMREAANLQQALSLEKHKKYFITYDTNGVSWKANMSTITKYKFKCILLEDHVAIF